MNMFDMVADHVGGGRHHCTYNVCRPNLVKTSAGNISISIDQGPAMLQTPSLEHNPPANLDSMPAASSSSKEQHDVPKLLRTRAAIRTFIKEHDVLEGLMPTNQQLISAGQTDLKNSIVQLGGLRKVAASMDLLCSTARYPTLDLAVKAMQEFAQEQYGDPSRAPSYRRLRQMDRSELTVSYMKFGYARVLEAAGMTANKSGPRRDTAASKHLVCQFATCCNVLLHAFWHMFNGELLYVMIVHVIVVYVIVVHT